MRSCLMADYQHMTLRISHLSRTNDQLTTHLSRTNFRTLLLGIIYIVYNTIGLDTKRIFERYIYSFNLMDTKNRKKNARALAYMHFFSYLCSRFVNEL